MTQHFDDGSAWSGVAGYSRAVRRGELIAVSGTTATAPGGDALHPGDTYAQARECFDRVLHAVAALGGAVTDVLETVVYLAPQADWTDAARAHQEAFGEVAPANTMLHVAALIGDGFLVEASARAVVSDS